MAWSEGALVHDRTKKTERSLKLLAIKHDTFREAKISDKWHMKMFFSSQPVAIRDSLIP